MRKIINPEISIVIITLNEEKYISRLLESIQLQTFKNFEIIVSDATSKDGTRRIARKYGCKIVRGGVPPVARNNGAKRAKGNYIVFFDADCVLKNKNFLKLNINAFKKSGNGIASTYIKPIEDTLVDNFLFWAYNFFVKSIKRFSSYGTGACIFVKNDIFVKIKGFNEKLVFAEDQELFKRAKKYGFAILPIEIYTSTRRMKNEGRIKTSLKLLYTWFYRTLYKEITYPIFDYKNVR